MSKRSPWLKLSRKLHYYGAIACALPILIVIVSGILLILRKDLAWVQPPTQKGQSTLMTLSFEQILQRSKAVEIAAISNWDDISRLDVRPSKGLIKVRAKSGWELQLDSHSGKLLHTAYRRTGMIESIHQGTFFHDYAKYGLFLPASCLLLLLLITGTYMGIKRLAGERKNNLRATSMQKKSIAPAQRH